MLIVLFVLHGDSLYNYYYVHALDPSLLYYKNLIPSETSSDLRDTTDILYYFNYTIKPNFFPDQQLSETSNVWIGPMKIIQVKFQKTLF